MRIAVLASGDGWHVQDLVRAAAGLGHIVEPISFRHLEGWIADGAPVRARPAPFLRGTQCTVPDAQYSVLGTPYSVPGTQHSVPRSTSAESSLREVSAEPVTTDLSKVDRMLVRTMPFGSLEQVVFRMDVLHRLLAAGVPVLNPPQALEAAVDKYLACCRLEAAGLPVPPTVACENSDVAWDAFHQLGGDVVVKPIFGSEGKGITRVSDPDVAYRVFRTLERVGSVLYLQKFIAHEGFDLRAFVLGDQVLAAMRRRHDSDWRTNVARGARGEPIELTPAQVDLAIRAARAMGTAMAGVDLLLGRDGEMYVLEVNAVPGWRALSRVTGVDVGHALLHFAALNKWQP